MTGEHAPEYRHRIVLRLSVGAAETEQSLRAVFAGGQGLGEGGPFCCGRVIEPVLSVLSRVQARSAW